MSFENVRSALTWAGGVQVLRDVCQFAAMLLLVRLLSPEQYGAAALAQTILGIATLIGAGSFVTHALQIRDPNTIDWQSHFTAATVWNAVISLALIALSEFVVTPIWGADVGLSLAVLALAPILGGAAEVRNTMLRAHHKWIRFRFLSLAGTFLSIGFGIALGLTGFGVIALAVQPVLYVLPAAVDLFWSGFRPKWSFDRTYYRDSVAFGLNRVAAGSINSLRGFAEQALVTANFSLAFNGVYNRSVGLSQLLAGRFGTIAMMALYPILTRSERGSLRFRDNAGRVLQGISWIAIPAAVFLSIEAQPIVALLYGTGWLDVVYLLPPASAMITTGILTTTVSQLLLANESRQTALTVEMSFGFAGMCLAFWLVPKGLALYLWALSAMGALTFAFGVSQLVKDKAIEPMAAVIAVLPPLVASALASTCVVSIGAALELRFLFIKVAVSAACFGFVYLTVLFVAFRRPALDMLVIIPGMNRFGAERCD